MSAQADRFPRPLRPSQRRRRDLSFRRLALGLLAAPLGPIALVGLPLTAVLGIFALIVVGVIAGAAIVWSLIFGFAYLHTITRIRGIVGRAECILLGVGAALSLPLAALVLSYAWDASGDLLSMNFDPNRRGGDGAGTALFFSILFAPFGGLSGWIFWRIGVWPAREPISDFTAVFE